MIAKAYTIALLSIVLIGSTNAGHIIHHNHSKRANTCGSKGYDRGSALSLYPTRDSGQGNYFYDNGGKLNSYAACSAACIADTKCKSFGYSTQECMLFNIPLSGNFDADKSSSEVYYDLACLSAAKSPLPASATSSSASKTSSTAPAAKASSTSKSLSKPSGPATTPSSLSSKTSTAAVIATPSSAGGATVSSSSAAPTVDFPTGNPYETKGCPMPTALAISNLKSTIDPSTGWNNGSIKIQYGNGTFTCPGRCGSQDGLFNCICDSNGMLQIESDGRSWIRIQQAYWCDAQPQRPNKAYESLALTLNFTALADYLTCDKKTNTCTQSKPLLAPVGGYGGGPLIGFTPIDTNGNDLPNCPYRPGHSPVVTSTATCTGA